LGESPDQDFTDDYPKIGGNVCWNPSEEGRLIIMVAPARAPSQNSSNQYPTIGRLEVSDARTPDDRFVQNLNLDFNTVRLHTILESIQRKGSPLVALAQQGVETANNGTEAKRSVSNRRGEPSIGNRSDGRAKHARSEVASLANGNTSLADNDARWQIT
jgi:hypothetical protein